MLRKLKFVISTEMYLCFQLLITRHCYLLQSNIFFNFAILAFRLLLLPLTLYPVQTNSHYLLQCIINDCPFKKFIIFLKTHITIDIPISIFVSVCPSVHLTITLQRFITIMVIEINLQQHSPALSQVVLYIVVITPEK